MSDSPGRRADLDYGCLGRPELRASLQAIQASNRRDFIKHVGSMGLGIGLSPALAFGLQGQAGAAEMAGSAAVQRGNAQPITILHTSDIHAQLDTHHEFFYEGGRPTFRRRGGLPRFGR